MGSTTMSCSTSIGASGCLLESPPAKRGLSGPALARTSCSINSSAVMGLPPSRFLIGLAAASLLRFVAAADRRGLRRGLGAARPDDW